MCSDQEFNEGTHEAYCLGRKEAIDNIRRVYEKYSYFDFMSIPVMEELLDAIRVDLGRNEKKDDCHENEI